MTTANNESPSSQNDHRHLILMRHAKSDWSDESLSDHDRSLNRRGRRDTPRMAHWLAELGLIPDMILSSSSVRTKETVALMVDEWSDEPTCAFSESLYLSPPETILRTVRSDGCDAQRLMVVAHNPGMAHLVSGLSQQVVDMPTAAIAIFRLANVEWNSLQPSTDMSLVQYMRPKAL